MKNAHASLSPTLEALEPRLAPAGVVTITISGGILTLTGDGGNNVVEITSPSSNIWKIADPKAGESGNIDTYFRIAGRADATSFELPTFAGLKVSLNDGHDVIDVNNLFTNGAVTLLGGNGDDKVLLSGTINGVITMDGGSGNDELALIGGLINNSITIKGGTGNDKVFFGGGVYARGITADLGTGSNEFTLLSDNSINVFGSVAVTAAGGSANLQNYFVGMKAGAVIGSMSFKTGAGAANYYMGRDTGDALTVYGSLIAQGSAGDDSMLLAGKFSIGTGINVNFGAGANVLENATTGTANVSQLSFLGIGGLSYTGGSGLDSIYLDVPEILVGGNVTANLGAGNNQLILLNSLGTVIGGSLSYVGGAGNDWFELNGAQATIGGKLSYKGGGSLDTDRFHFTPVYAVVGSLEAIGGGTGTDLFYLGAPDGTTTTLVSVLGDVVTNTGAGVSKVFIVDTIVQGKVTHSSSVTSTASDADMFVIEDGYITGALVVNTGGSAAASIYLNDSIFISTVNVSTGAGNDFVGFDTVTQNNLRQSSFYGAVNVSLGVGNDGWFAGGNPYDANLGNSFSSTVKIDGGTGDNIAVYYFSNNGSNLFAFAPVFQNMQLS